MHHWHFAPEYKSQKDCQTRMLFQQAGNSLVHILLHSWLCIGSVRACGLLLIHKLSEYVLSSHLCQQWLDNPEGLRLECYDSLMTLYTEAKGRGLQAVAQWL